MTSGGGAVPATGRTRPLFTAATRKIPQSVRNYPDAAPGWAQTYIQSDTATPTTFSDPGGPAHPNAPQETGKNPTKMLDACQYPNWVEKRLAIESRLPGQRTLNRGEVYSSGSCLWTSARRRNPINHCELSN